MSENPTKTFIFGIAPQSNTADALLTNSVFGPFLRLICCSLGCWRGCPFFSFVRTLMMMMANEADALVRALSLSATTTATASTLSLE